MRTFLTALLLTLLLTTPTFADTFSAQWDPVAGDSTHSEATGYELCWATTPTGATTCISTTAPDTNSTLTTLTSCQRYYINARAVDGDGDKGGFSNQINGLPDIKLTTTSPAAVKVGQPAVVTFTGTNFATGTTITSPTATITNPTITSCTSMSATVNATSTGSIALQFNYDGITTTFTGQLVAVTTWTPNTPTNTRRLPTN